MARKVSRHSSDVLKDFESSLDIILKKKYEQFKSESKSLKSKLSRHSSDVLKDFESSLDIILKKKYEQFKSESRSFKSESSLRENTLTKDIVGALNVKQRFKLEPQLKSNSPLIGSSLNPPSSGLLNFLNPKSPLAIPFESTNIHNLSFTVSVIFADNSNSKRLNINIGEVDTVHKLKLQIERKTNISYRRQFIMFSSRPLENSQILTSLGIRARSQLLIRVEKKIYVAVIHEDCKKRVGVYKSDSIYLFRHHICECFSILNKLLTLTLNDTTLDDKRDLFCYNINENSLIKVFHRPISAASFNHLSDAFLADEFIRMTEELNVCQCQDKKLEAIANIMTETNVNENVAFLKNYTSNLHHQNCAKATLMNRKLSKASFFSEWPSASDSVTSLEDYIHAEIKRTDNKSYAPMDKTDYEFLAKSNNFKTFKRYLRVKIGTDCNLRSVTMLYKCARELIIFIGFEEDTYKEKWRRRMLEYIKKYFLKYFESHIIEEGGLAALSMSGSDIDE